MTEKQAREVIALDKRFEMFLRKNKLIKEYIKAFKRAGNYPIPDAKPDRYIDNTLYWDATPQGWKFWDRNYQKCKLFFKDLENEI